LVNAANEILGEIDNNPRKVIFEAALPLGRLHSMVHGGNHVLDQYGTETPEIGFKTDPVALISLTVTAVIQSSMAVAFSISRFAKNGIAPSLPPGFNEAAEAFKASIPRGS
jgi:hypothetical protein